MSASKLLLSSNRFLRSSNTHTYKSSSSLPIISFFPFSSFFSLKPISELPSFKCHRHSSTSSASLDTLASNDSQHPWPEWVSFIDKLKTKGYLSTSATTTTNDVVENVYEDMNQLKDPCLNFARDRYDLLKLLCVDDIETVVKNGCPNLLRKSVNSAKRLRAFLRLDEGDVCSACNLRGSCDRAYLILKDNEGDARTVDIVRILLAYALDPLVGSEEAKPPAREVIEASVRKLLSDLVELSQKIPDPPVLKLVAKTVHQKENERRFSDEKRPPQPDVLGSGKLSQDVEMKRGDWMCPKCDFMNFARNKRCLKCHEEGPNMVGGSDMEMKKGDWTCSKCDFMNFSRNIKCLKCKAEKPTTVGVKDVGMKMKIGDWNCSQCGFMNFASNKACLHCREPRPKRQLLPGDWECPSCDFWNYSRNDVCFRCKGARPKEATTEYEEQVWKSPY